MCLNICRVYISTVIAVTPDSLLGLVFTARSFIIWFLLPTRDAFILPTKRFTTEVDNF
jgi:hypothetical protein